MGRNGNFARFPRLPYLRSHQLLPTNLRGRHSRAGGVAAFPRQRHHLAIATDGHLRSIRGGRRDDGADAGVAGGRKDLIACRGGHDHHVLHKLVDCQAVLPALLPPPRPKRQGAYNLVVVRLSLHGRNVVHLHRQHFLQLPPASAAVHIQ